MAFGHLLAVTIQLTIGSLRGSVLLVYAIGVVLAIPSWLLIVLAARRPRAGDALLRLSAPLNAWLCLSLLAMGFHNLPLAIPALLNIAYRFHSRRVAGVLVIAAGALVYVFLLVGSLVFLASGRTFEEFRGID
jgi:hypothetical protein